MLIELSEQEIDVLHQLARDNAHHFVPEFAAQLIAKLRNPQQVERWQPLESGFYEDDIFVWDYGTNKHEDSGRFTVGYNPDSNHNKAWLAFIHDAVIIEAQLPDNIRLCRKVGA